VVDRVTFVLPSLAAGGAQRVLLTLAAGLDRSRFAPSVVVFGGGGPWRELVADDIPLIELNGRRLRHALFALRKAIARDRPDFIVSTMSYANLSLLLLRPFLPRSSKIIVREANTTIRERQSGLSRHVSALLYSWLYPRAYRVISPSDVLAAELSEQLRVPRALITVLRNPVNVAQLRDMAAAPRRFPGPGRRFVAVGRLTRQKGYDRLLDLIAGCDADTHLTILGEGEERDVLTRQIRELHLDGRVSMPGFDAKAASWVAGGDALLLASRWEGLPNVALEALACGTPVIATPESGAIDEICALAPPGAVTIAPIGLDFARAMAATAINATARLRPSLLPAEFALDRINAQFAQILDVAT